MNKYEILKDIGGGSYGTVYEGINKETHQKVAIKKLKQKIDSWEDCMNQNEVYFLRKLNHPNVIKLIEVIREQNSDISFVFEYCECNLYEFITNHRKRKKSISENKIQNIIYNITRGLSYIHSQNIMHRDLKPENILISINDNDVSNNLIKIADFGTAKEIPPYKNEFLTDYICTRWYRAPACVLKSKNYDEKVDIWALGCIMAELYNLRPLFPGQSEFDQMDKIVKILGTPKREDWPEGYRLMESLKMEFPQYKRKNFHNLFFDISEEAINFLEYIFIYDSVKRPSANDLLNHPYLSNSNNNLNMNKFSINTYSNHCMKNNNIYPLKDINNAHKYPISFTYKDNTDEKNNYPNNLNKPNYLLSPLQNSINVTNSRFSNEDIFFNQKSNGRSKSSIINTMKNPNLSNNNNIYNQFSNNMKNNNYSNILDYENRNQELSDINKMLDTNIMKLQNNFDSMHNLNRNNKYYTPFNNEYNTTLNNAFSSIAKNGIIQKPVIFNKYFDKQKETINNEDIFHNVMPKIRRLTNSNNNYYMFNDNKNLGYNYNKEGTYKSFFATRYNL